MLYTSNTFVPYNNSVKEADAVFLGIPFGSTSTAATSNYGPTVVREALKLIESKLGLIKIADIGDLEVVPGSFELTGQRTQDTIEEVMMERNGPMPFAIFVGGNHSITLPICEALKAKTIVVLDAHADCRPDYLGNVHTHQTWAWHASKFAKVINIGLAACSMEEEQEIKDNNNIVCMTPKEFLCESLDAEPPIHLSIDVDVFDPAYVETGLPEGRMNPKQVWPILNVLAPHIASMDIVEIAETQLVGKTAFLAARIIKAVLERRFLSGDAGF